SPRWPVSASYLYRISGTSVPLLQPGEEDLRRAQPIGRSQQVRDLAPVDLGQVEAHGQPALLAEIRRHEETLRVLLHEPALLARRSFAPQRDQPVAVVV